MNEEEAADEKLADFLVGQVCGIVEDDAELVTEVRQARVLREEALCAVLAVCVCVCVCVCIYVREGHRDKRDENLDVWNVRNKEKKKMTTERMPRTIQKTHLSIISTRSTTKALDESPWTMAS